MQSLFESLLQLNPMLPIVYGAMWVGFFIFLGFVMRAISSLAWPSTRGIVVRSRMESKQRLSQNGGKTTLYDLDFEYQYRVAGQQFTGKKVRNFHVMTNSRKFVETFTTSFPAGSEIEVYYSPQNPERSLIIPGVSAGIWMFVFFFLLSIGSMSAVIYQRLH